MDGALPFKKSFPASVSSVTDIVDMAIKWGTQENRTEVWWRGQADSAWHPRPGIFREDASDRREFNMVSRFQIEAPSRQRQLPRHDDYPGWLFLMQHHGLPTRLLDWTTSVLVASYFAVSRKNELDRDGCLFALNPVALNELFIAAGRGLLLPDAIECIPYIAPAFGGNGFNDESARSRAVAVIPNQVDPQMMLQRARFTVHTSERCLEDHPRVNAFLARVLIPQDRKIAIHDDLAKLGVSESALFPDLRSLAYELQLQTFGRGPGNSLDAGN